MVGFLFVYISVRTQRTAIQGEIWKGNMSEEVTNAETPAEDVEAKTTEDNATDGDTSDVKESVDTESGKDIPDVPYDRFKEVISERNTLREQAAQLNEQITKLNKSPTKEATSKDTISTDDADTLDALIRERAEAGNPVTYEELGQMYFDRFQSMQEQMQKEARKQVDNEVKALYDKGLIKTKEDENAVLAFAMEKSEELGQKISLDVAAQWMKDSTKRSDEPKEVSSKTQSSRKSSGIEKPNRDYQRDVRGKDLDEIIMEAKSEFSK